MIENEIYNPHGGGIYGHQYYGFLRDHAEFLIQSNNDHAGRYAMLIDAMLEDGAITEEERKNVTEHLKQLHISIQSSLVAVLEKGDDIHRKFAEKQTNET
jgi:hypothetical protein